MFEIDLGKFIDVNIEAVCEAGDSIEALFGVSTSELETDWKEDETPVTKADHLSENVVKDIIRKHFKGLPLILEESGQHVGKDDKYLCLVDPLDGTSSFFRGIPTYSILIALVQKVSNDEHHVVTCTVYEPQTGRIWFAVKGRGARLCKYNKYRRELSQPKSIKVTSPYLFPKENSMIIYDAALKFRNIVPDVSSKSKALSSILPMFRRGRMIGSLALQFSYVASGFAEATVADAVGGPYDLCGHLLVDEAGGLTSDMYGNPIDIFNTKVAIASNGDRHQEITNAVREIYQNF